MSQVRKILVEELQDLYSAEQQLVAALPKMADAAKNPALREHFELHLTQTEGQVARLEEIFDLLGEESESKECRGMMGLLEEGQERIKQAKDMDPLAADLSLISAAQRIEHYEIAAYGTARTLARQAGEIEVARLLSHTLGEEEATDAMLTMCAVPILQQVTAEDFEGAGNDMSGSRPSGRNAAFTKRGSKRGSEERHKSE